MKRNLRVLAAAGSLVLAFSIGDAAFAQKQGGTLKIYFFDSPASMSIHEETTAAGQGPMMGVFNNLVLYRQDVPQSGLQSIVPDLASDWSWDEDKTQLSFRLREGVNWHGQAVHGKRRSMHLGPTRRQIEREAPHQSS
jgi:peptide/nickel transport system substrate-binding protein